MTNFTRNKRAITERVIKLYDPDPTERELELALSTWWANVRRNGGLGLTSAGKEAFDLAGLDYWDIPVKIVEIIKSSTRLKLDRHIHCPWFLTGIGVGKGKFQPTLRLYDSRIASMVILYGGLEAYLDNHAKKV